ncbi:SMC-Scp complex subunit ScpB [uncultured Peptoniphilus sp.]|uniref:SMC-Scp complex subunit ScpB n=1 Tax=uncultured Peptoniphilus sp. TaxID=254354 RepID=UPI0028044694|nr:SMC-Scp complex subunit ScpB [uncultured Peptoniphilus sp.]
MDFKAIIEGILFAWGDKVRVSEIAKSLEISEKETNKYIDEMIGDMDNSSRGLRIIRIDDSVQIGTKPEIYDYINDFVVDRNKKNISGASMETLSIIAYKQPITKIEIEEIRGVKCDYTLKTLSDLNLITEVGRLDRIGKPIIYGTTSEFLKQFGLEKIEDLPEVDNFKENEELTFLEGK